MIQLDAFDGTRLRNARHIVRDLGSVLVAYSGGVDSTLLLKLALDELGDGAVAVLASSPAYPESEQQAARELAGVMGARLVLIEGRVQSADNVVHIVAERLIDRTYEMSRLSDGSLGLGLPASPKIQAWIAELQKRPAFQKATATG